MKRTFAIVAASCLAVSLFAQQRSFYQQTDIKGQEIGKLTGDRTKIQEGQKYSEQSAAIAGPFQQRASQNAAAMKTELAAPRR